MLSSPVFAASNPLHFAYYNLANPSLPVIGSTRGLLQDYTQELGFSEQVRLYDVANTPQALIEADAQAHKAYITWRPVRTEFTVMGNAYELAASLENKTHIRHVLPKALFPAFIVIEPEEIRSLHYAALSNQLGGSTFVLQIDNSTGGTGTYIVTNQYDLESALTVLVLAGRPVVASRFVSGTSRGLQCIMINGKIYSNAWWHKDLVGLPDICDMTQPGSR